MKTLLLLLSLFLYASHALQPGCENIAPSNTDSSTLRIMHVFNPCSPFKPSKPISWEESVLQMEANDQARMQYLSSLAVVAPSARGRGRSFVPIAPGQQLIQRPNYIVQAQFGTPKQALYVALDTGNDAAWIPCAGCIGCPGPIAFDPKKSPTFKSVGCQSPSCKQVPNSACGVGGACDFSLTYGSSNISAGLSQDTLTLAADAVPRYTFGCIQKATGNSILPQGLLGLGRGPLSLLSQTQPLYQSTFSYCLPSFKALNFTGSLKLGPKYQPVNIKTTPLLMNPRRSSLYYVEMIGVRVGRKVVDIPPSALAFNPATGAGTIFDSGTVFSRLVKAAYIPLRDAFRARVGKGKTVSSLGGFDTCYNGPINDTTITFMFKGMNVTLPADNFLIHSSASGITCLAMAAAPDNVNSVLNVIANMQQQNHRVFYDIPRSRLGVSRELCS